MNTNIKNKKYLIELDYESLKLNAKEKIIKNITNFMLHKWIRFIKEY